MSIASKIAAIQWTIGSVQTTPTDPKEGEDPFRYAAYEDVCDVARAAMKRHAVVALPSVVSVKAVAGGRQMVRVRLAVELVDLDSGDSTIGMWEGESHQAERGLAGAHTAALKGFFISTFLIEVCDPEDRNARRQRIARANPLVTSAQVNNFIVPVLREVGLSDEDLLALLRDHFEVDKLRRLPRAKAAEVVDRIRRKAQEVAA